MGLFPQKSCIGTNKILGMEPTEWSETSPRDNLDIVRFGKIAGNDNSREMVQEWNATEHRR